MANKKVMWCLEALPAVIRAQHAAKLAAGLFCDDAFNPMAYAALNNYRRLAP